MRLSKIKFLKRKRGFTLIELLVVIAIIGILATIIVISYVNAQAKARDNVRKSDILAISSAVEMYYLDNKKYPCVPNTPGEYYYRVRSVNSISEGIPSERWSSGFGGILASYISTPLAEDPINRNDHVDACAAGCVAWQVQGDDYNYTYLSTDKSYVLAARLEVNTSYGNGVRFYGNFLVGPDNKHLHIPASSSLEIHMIDSKYIYFVGANIVKEDESPI